MAKKAGRRRRKVERFLRQEFKKVDNETRRQSPEFILGVLDEDQSVLQVSSQVK
ncbi:hypothetical protein [Bacillus massiliglaciei]|uniref:hypothetical protein n=1 Tax=Bacillus massiliglaciei TaxID=1816693 RepID=UPI0018FE4925|nr:hypothetical protein [Bacillus massiliglaciei]